MADKVQQKRNSLGAAASPIVSYKNCADKDGRVAEDKNPQELNEKKLDIELECSAIGSNDAESKSDLQVEDWKDENFNNSQKDLHECEIFQKDQESLNQE